MSDQVISVKSTPVWESITWLRERFRFSNQDMRILLGFMPQSTYYRGLKTREVVLEHDRLCRVSLLLDCYNALMDCHKDYFEMLNWMEKENSLSPFNGMCPKNYILVGDYMHLYWVREFITGSNILLKS